MNFSGFSESVQQKLLARCGQLIVVATVLILAAGQWETVRSLANGLSPTADPFTEADVVRAGEGYAKMGFLANWGLPDLCFGDQFPEQGIKNLLRKERDKHSGWERGALGERSQTEQIDDKRFIYTHYPPGPHWMAGVLTLAFGRGHINAFRAVPVLLGLIAIIYLSWVLARLLGWIRAAVAIVFLCALPMVGNMLHGLAYQSYALALLIIQVAVLLQTLRDENLGRRRLAALFALAFLQGLLGFDYAFLVILSPFAIWMLRKAGPAAWVLPARAAGAAAAGFVLAHALHFGQVAGYFGSLEKAVQDFASTAKYRSVGETLDHGLAAPSRSQVLSKYLTVEVQRPEHFGTPIVPWIVAAMVVSLLIWLLRASALSPLTIIAPLLGLAISSFWVMLMPQHSAQHWHFIPRHYIFAVLIAMISVISGTAQTIEVSRARFQLIAVASVAVLVVFGIFAGTPATIALHHLLLSWQSLFAYGLVAAILVVCIQRKSNALPRAILFAPLAYLLIFLACTVAAESLLGVDQDAVQLGVRTWMVLVPYVLVIAYSYIALAWLTFRRLERTGELVPD